MIKPLLAASAVILTSCASTAQYIHAPGPMLPKYREPNGPYEYTSSYQHSDETYVRTPEGWRYVVWHPHNLVSAEASPGYVLTTEEALAVVDSFVEKHNETPPPAIVASRTQPSAAAPVTSTVEPTTARSVAFREPMTALPKEMLARAPSIWERFCGTAPMTPGEMDVIEATAKPSWLVDCIPLK